MPGTPITARAASQVPIQRSSSSSAMSNTTCEDLRIIGDMA
jgi:hypothetical protein